MKMNLDWRVVGAAAALIVAVVFAYQVRLGDAYDAWELRAESIRDSSAAAVETFRAQAVVLDSLLAASRAEAREAVGAREAAEDRLRDIDTLPPPPPECEGAVAVRDTIYRAVVDTLVVSNDMYRSAWAAAVERGDTLQAAAQRLAAQLALNVELLDERPKDRWYVPEVGAGAFAGICTSGAPCVGVGATLSWKLRF